MHKALYPTDDIDRLSVSRKEGGRRIASIKDWIKKQQKLENKNWKKCNCMDKSTKSHTKRNGHGWPTTSKEKYTKKYKAQKSHHLISARRLYLLIIKKKKEYLSNSGFAVPAENWVSPKESEKWDKSPDLAVEIKNFKKLCNIKVTLIQICNSGVWKNSQRIEKRKWKTWK